jgi:hypothetical protein
LLPAPTAPSEGSAGVRNLVKTRRPQPALDPGSPAQASLPIEPLPLARSPTGLPDCAARGFAGPSPDPAWQSQNRPMFCGPSWVDHSCVPLCSSPIRRPLPSRVALEEDQLFRRLIPTDSASAPRSFNIACRRRSDLWSPAAPACRCRLLGRPGPPSRSPDDHAHVRRVAKAKNQVRSLWITGISVTTVGTLSRIANPDPTQRNRRGCRSVPLRLPRPSA